jgi:broad specificity phosphatase PhoE
VLLFDEPTVSLDELTEERIYELVHQLQTQKGIILILVSHDLSVVYRYASKITDEIRNERFGWEMVRDGCPGGETAEQVGVRADRVVSRVRAVDGNALLFSSGHFLRGLAGRWLGVGPEAGKFFLLSTTSLSALEYEDDRSQPAIHLWDDTCHLGM